MNRKVKLQKGKQIQQEEVKEAIVSLIQENKNDIIKARSQKAKVICFNGTPTYANFLLNQYASDNNNGLTINNTLSSVMEMLMNANNTLMPIIFGGSAIDFNYRFSTALFTIPTTPKPGLLTNRIISNINMVMRILERDRVVLCSCRRLIGINYHIPFSLCFGFATNSDF